MNFHFSFLVVPSDCCSEGAERGGHKIEDMDIDEILARAEVSEATASNETAGMFNPFKLDGDFDSLNQD